MKPKHSSYISFLSWPSEKTWCLNCGCINNVSETHWQKTAIVLCTSHGFCGSWIRGPLGYAVLVQDLLQGCSQMSLGQWSWEDLTGAGGHLLATHSLTCTASCLRPQLPSGQLEHPQGYKWWWWSVAARLPVAGAPPLSGWPPQASLLLSATSDSKSGEYLRGWPCAGSVMARRLGSDLLASVAAFVGAGLCLMKRRILLHRKGECEV